MKRMLMAGLLMLMSGCGIAIPLKRNESKLTRLNLDADRSYIIKTIGLPTASRGSKKQEDGSILQIDEYWLYARNAAMWGIMLGIFTGTVSWWLPFPDPY